MTDWLEEANSTKDYQSEILSFSSYFEQFQSNPDKELRSTCKYLLDMINFFGKCEKGLYNLFSQQQPDSPAVFGQQTPEKSIIENLINFLEEGINNKFILLVGPNGSSKSSIVKKIMKGSEIYSESYEGALYSFSWIFPIENYVAPRDSNIPYNMYGFFYTIFRNGSLDIPVLSEPIQINSI